METKNVNREIELFAKKIIENLNVVYSMVLSDKYEFGEIEDRFRQVTDVLIQYQCYDSAAEQLINFSKMVFFRGLHEKALQLGEEAIQTCLVEKKQMEYVNTVHEMAFKLLEIGLESNSNTDTLKLAEKYLLPDDYIKALRNAIEKCRTANTQEMKMFLGKLALEVLRQAIRYEKTDPKQALFLLREDLPYLNEKRANVVRKEIDLLESRGYGDK